jgi:hypothetical protein
MLLLYGTMVGQSLLLTEESPGSTQTIELDNVQRGSYLRESATENKPPEKVRVKWCGKSAPHFW